MQDNHEVLTMERLHDLISEACECISVANNKTKVKLRKIIQNESFEFLNGEPSDLIKAIDILWSEQPEDAVVIKTINEWKLEGIKVIEDEYLLIKIIDKENICDETRRSFPGSYDYIVEIYLKGYTTILSKDSSMVESIELLGSCGCLEGRADSTIGEVLKGYGKKIYSFTEKFCLINNVKLEVREKLLKVAKVNYILTGIIISDCRKRLIEGSNYVEIVDSLKNHHKEVMNVKPREKGFRAYLDDVLEIHNLHLDDVLMQHLADHVVSERVKNFSFIQEAKDKQQALIDITPHQTLSIEAAAATVEESKIILTKTGEKFTLPQIALIYYYDGLALNGNNCNDIILTYGWNSGKKLREWHTKFDTGNSIRLYSHSSGKRIYSVLEYLTTEKGKTDAKKDLKDIGFDFE